MICQQCGKEFKKIKTSKDNICGKCRSKNKYIQNIDDYRKTKNCPDCGKKILKSSNFCSSCSQKENKNHRWKSDKQDRKIYTLPEWRVWRKHVLKRDNHTCQNCGQIGGRLHAHHILPKRLFPYLIFNIDNGITLCHACHSKIQFKEEEFSETLVQKRIRPK